LETEKAKLKYKAIDIDLVGGYMFNNQVNFGTGFRNKKGQMPKSYKTLVLYLAISFVI
jgi:hypothetical protein